MTFFSVNTFKTGRVFWPHKFLLKNCAGKYLVCYSTLDQDLNATKLANKEMIAVGPL